MQTHDISWNPLQTCSRRVGGPTSVRFKWNAEAHGSPKPAWLIIKPLEASPSILFTIHPWQIHRQKSSAHQFRTRPPPARSRAHKCPAGGFSKASQGSYGRMGYEAWDQPRKLDGWWFNTIKNPENSWEYHRVQNYCLSPPICSRTNTHMEGSSNRNTISPSPQLKMNHLEWII